MAETTNLKLPLISGSQAQKHVTHNEALQILDETVGASYDPSGAATLIKAVSQEITLSGATEDTTIAFPNQSIILGASCRVSQTITGCTSFNAGDSTSATRYGSGINVAAWTYNQGTIGPSGNYSDTVVRLTAVGGGASFTGGKVIVTLHYMVLQYADMPS